MTEYVYLQGSEDVARAASTMSQAAADMNRAAGTIESAMHQHRMFMDELIGRLETALDRFAQGLEAK